MVTQVDSKKVAILQSNYVPWKGYFDLIGYVDHFVLLDEVQFTKRDWRNRNQIKTPTGLQWLTVPVHTRGKYSQTISQTRIDGDAWRHKHLNALLANYRRAREFDKTFAAVEPIYLQKQIDSLSELNEMFIRAICESLGTRTPISHSHQFDLDDDPSRRLLTICQQLGATHYVSGPAAKSYLDVELFCVANIEVEWFDYSGYQTYPQLWGDFEHHVSVLDLLFNCGDRSREFLRHNS